MSPQLPPAVHDTAGLPRHLREPVDFADELKLSLRERFLPALAGGNEKGMNMRMMWITAMVVGGVGGSWPTAASTQSAEAVAGRFVANGAEVTDTQTGLVWRRCLEGQNWTGSTCSGSEAIFNWQAALDRAKSAASGGIPWRLPNAKELGSLVDESRVGPAINESAFPGMPGNLVWTSTHFFVRDSSYAMYVDFYSGLVKEGLRYAPYAVRLVRSSQ